MSAPPPFDPAAKKIRLFTALPLPPAVKDALSHLPRKGLEKARWSHPDDLHITLRFLGDVEAGLLPEIKDALSRFRRPAFYVEMAGLGVFHTGRQAVLWADIHSTRKMTALAAEINEALEPLGFEMPRKPFRPHVTLARLKKPHGLEHYLKTYQSKVRGNWQAGSFGLFLSAEPDKKGSRYSMLGNYTLDR